MLKLNAGKIQLTQGQFLLRGWDSSWCFFRFKEKCTTPSLEPFNLLCSQQANFLSVIWPLKCHDNKEEKGETRRANTLAFEVKPESHLNLDSRSLPLMGWSPLGLPGTFTFLIIQTRTNYSTKILPWGDSSSHQQSLLPSQSHLENKCFFLYFFLSEGKKY